MKKKLCFFLLILSAFNSPSTYAARDLRSQANLHPLDTFTADTLKEGEWYYGQPPIPAPGYSFYGLTENTTIQLDYTAWLGGVPSFNLRQKLFGNNRSKLRVSTEFMIIYMDESLDEMDEDQDYLFIKREGTNGYARVNLSYRLTDDVRLHGSLGFSYSEYLRISNENRPQPIGEEFVDLVDPTFMLGYEHYITDNLMFVGNISYGETWLLLENRPRKEQLVYGFRWTPFTNSSRPILKNMAVDLIALFARFPDAEEELAFGVPLFPVFTWQW